jgi:S-DNA-T family DNA segregation ATPase FtsK/SpoIIIE
MDERYELLAEAGVRNIAGYNKLTQEELIERFNPSTPEEEAKIPKKLPYIVVIIDELADLMMTSGKEVEAHIVRIAQKARAVGIHLIVATQRPQANVVTGLIKSNMPSKIAFRVNSKMDSRIVLDQNGAECLLGQGDMLFLPPGASKPIRSQGTFIDDMEIKLSVKKVKELAEAQYEPELVQIRNGITMAGDEERDPLYDDAVRVVLETKRGSVSLLQRRLTVGYARASRMIEQMAQDGIVGEYKGSQAREATITVEEWEALKAQQAALAAAGEGDEADLDPDAEDVDSDEYDTADAA